MRHPIRHRHLLLLRRHLRDRMIEREMIEEGREMTGEDMGTISWNLSVPRQAMNVDSLRQKAGPQTEKLSSPNILLNYY